MADEHQEYINRMAVDHWTWLRSVLLQQLEVSGRMYIDAFKHGYKHCEDDFAKEPVQAEMELRLEGIKGGRGA